MSSVVYDGLAGAVIGAVIGFRKWRQYAAIKKTVEADEVRAAEESLDTGDDPPAEPPVDPR
ncbi:hypothetical protein [Kribbella sp. NPDC000426]|uniref:hypothetical protein n=1 Tax=Kribbella sp. NPDC000426 TaxID=3154255 RepID=UPI00331CBA5E